MSGGSGEISTRQSLVVIVILLLLAALSFSTFLMAVKYPTYLNESGNEQAYEGEFGEDAAYLGELDGGADGIICKSGEDIHLIEGQDKPMNMDTFGDYLNAVASGEA